MFEHAEPGFPRLVEAHPRKLVGQAPLQVLVARAVRGDRTVHVSGAVPRGCDVGHRRRQHQLHRRGHVLHGGLGPVKKQQGFTGLGKPLRPVLDRILVCRRVGCPRETHGARRRRPEKCRQGAGGRIERERLRIFLDKILESDGHTASAIEHVDPSLGPFGAIDDAPVVGDRRREAVRCRQAQGRRRIRHGRNSVGLGAELHQTGWSGRHGRHSPVTR